MKTGMICGTGSYTPAIIMKNRHIEKLVDTNHEWIVERTGIENRHLTGGDETTTTMATKAAINALHNARLHAEEIDLILVSTLSPDMVTPSISCMVQAEIGAVNATCFDLNAACAGFMMAYNTAMSFIQTGLYHNCLVIASETISGIVDWTDRGTCTLFGDGAGAIVLRPIDKDRTYLPVSHSDGTKKEALYCANKQYYLSKKLLALSATDSLVENYDLKDLIEKDDFYIHMDGQDVFKFAVRKVPEVVMEVLDLNGLTTSDIDWYVMHQANARIIEGISRRLKEPIEKFPMNLQNYGNTSSATIPILLDEMNKRGMIKKGQKLLLAGFGAGLSWGACVVEWL